MTATDGVLLVGHGTVDRVDDMPDFLERIRRGRPATPALIEEMQQRYRDIGGSPLLDITRAQARALSKVLDLPVLVAMRMWHPFIEEVLAEALQARLLRLCVLPVAPFSVHVYHQATVDALEHLRRTAEGGELTLARAEAYGRYPALAEAHAEHILRTVSRSDLEDAELILTAHSLPLAATRSGDPYQRDFEACARAVAEHLGRSATIAYQSQGAGGGEWLGPDLETMLDEVRDRGARRVVVAPIGFVADHVETLYDLDIEAKAVANRLGLELLRVPALNTEPSFIQVMKNAVERARFS